MGRASLMRAISCYVGDAVAMRELWLASHTMKNSIASAAKNVVRAVKLWREHLVANEWRST
jgi:hypothetical protein